MEVRSSRRMRILVTQMAGRGLSVNEIARALISMVARSMTRSNQRPNTSMDGPTLWGLLQDFLAFDCLQSSIRSHRILMGFAERYPNIERSQVSDVSVGFSRSSVRQPIVPSILITPADLPGHTSTAIIIQLQQKHEQDCIDLHGS
jgi:hypothetical protein